jgi:hypothetical protein
MYVTYEAVEGAGGAKGLELWVIGVSGWHIE